MKTIYKYSLKTTDNQEIRLPEDAVLLDVQTQKGQPCIWALVDTEKPLILQKIRIIGTGHPIEPNFEGKYIGTYQVLNGDGIFHVFLIK